MKFHKAMPCGRFIVRVESTAPDDQQSTVQDFAKSENLSDVMAEGSLLALQTAVRVLESSAPATER
jgi:hypothetical protein